MTPWASVGLFASEQVEECKMVGIYFVLIGTWHNKMIVESYQKGHNSVVKIFPEYRYLAAKGKNIF